MAKNSKRNCPDLNDKCDWTVSDRVPDSKLLTRIEAVEAMLVAQAQTQKKWIGTNSIETKAARTDHLGCLACKNLKTGKQRYDVLTSLFGDRDASPKISWDKVYQGCVNEIGLIFKMLKEGHSIKTGDLKKSLKFKERKRNLCWIKVMMETRPRILPNDVSVEGLCGCKKSRTESTL